MLLRAPGLGVGLRRREKRCPHTWHGVFLWFRHLVLRASAGPLRDYGCVWGGNSQLKSSTLRDRLSEGVMGEGLA